ncbi:hydrolase beta-phosphoglucomutase family [Butyrivibrio proteoclasticus B316]|uniref:Hydrolase beta-phosphoglucomutase family n=1 Tax=Butyrivibrio proteoclasticus (strain ATCC 51982 / DSM 14932 / B316) TaxID=515622 RepID=E0RW28_BUTPB|nr:HAD family phosphatase [Butyrivibrio proteoclasticus]ADL32894.1 hydrolase beta-phosphoglucomutase family [Butyrivibrio proteoclasticus B316]
MGKIKAIIFDMDGVLIDAKEWHYEALNRALELFGYTITRYDHLVTYDGLPTRKKLEMLTKERNLPKELHGFINEMKQQYTMEIVHSKCKPVFQREYAISKLKSEGYKIGVASNSVKNSIVTMMEKSDLSKYLDTIVSNQDVKEGKPNPEIYIKAINNLGMKPEDCMVIEDNINGIKAGIAAGAHVMQVENVHDVTYDNIVKNIREFEETN